MKPRRNNYNKQRFIKTPVPKIIADIHKQENLYKASR